MAGLSLRGFEWFRQGGAKIENGRLIAPVDNPFPYRPAEYVQQLLTAIQQVRDETTALEFADKWGPLGLVHNAQEVENRMAAAHGALTFAVLRGMSWEKAVEAVDQVFFPEKPGEPPPVGDPLDRVLWFAEWTRQVSTVRRLLANFEDASDEPDPWARVREWMAEVSVEWWGVLMGMTPVFLQEIYNEGRWAQDSFEHFLVSTVLSHQRVLFSDRSRRGVWVGLHTSSYSTTEHEGQPVLHFDALFRFIEYTLLVHDGVPDPVRCADPKCGALFFPSRKGQRYCPPPPGARRSRCENRHGVERRRRGR